VEGFGLTETCPVICNPWQGFEKNSIGKPMKRVKIKITDKSDKIVKPGEIGKLHIKKRGMFSEYLNDPDSTKRLIKNGWFDTGDLVYRDRHDFLYFSKRDKEIAKIGGATVDINEIKKIILQNENVVSTEIIIQEDPLWQDKIVCSVAVKKDFTKEELIKYLRNNLSTAKIPKEINLNKE